MVPIGAMDIAERLPAQDIGMTVRNGRDLEQGLTMGRSNRIVSGNLNNNLAKVFNFVRLTL